MAVRARTDQDMTHPLPGGAGAVGLGVVTDHKSSARDRAQSLQGFQKQVRLWLTDDVDSQWSCTSDNPAHQSPGFRNEAASFARMRCIGIGYNQRCTALDLVDREGKPFIGERFITPEKDDVSSTLNEREANTLSFVS